MCPSCLGLGEIKGEKCAECYGERLAAYPRAACLHHKKIAELTALPLSELQLFLSSLTLTKEETLIASELIKEICERLSFLVEVGLSYLSLDRSSATLSGGEAQRVRLASQIGSGLVGVTYILDEPSIGLHPKDNLRLIQRLKQLRDLGNTVIVVEHDEETIHSADEVVDFGVGPGVLGGNIIYQGKVAGLLNCKESVTGAYLSGKKSIAIPEHPRKGNGHFLEIIGATHHNLKNITVSLPLGTFIAVTGVSGSGKSTLIFDILYPTLSNLLHKSDLLVGACDRVEGALHIDKVISIDQAPIGRTPRSNPATYIKLFDDIRSLFTKLPESLARGYLVGRFSFNVKEGSCTACQGMGMQKIEMDFMEDSWVECERCQGKRFDDETLSVTYKQKSMADILEMSVDEALLFFSSIPVITKKLQVLQRVGLGYMKLGQPSPTLSGGEAQRIKLAKELVRPSTGRTLYL
jgi:excinuclease ABC subunit A